MPDVSLEAGSPRARTAGRNAARPSGGAKQPAAKTARLQLHLGEQTIRRLGVHCALAGRNQSKEADRILLRYLSKEGRGRECFGETLVETPGEDLDPAE